MYCGNNISKSLSPAGVTALLGEREMDHEAVDNDLTLGETKMWGYPSGSAPVTRDTDSPSRQFIDSLKSLP